MAATAFPAAAIVSGTIATPRLGSGTADATSFLRGDSTWAVVPEVTRASLGLATTDSPTFAGATFSGQSASQGVIVSDNPAVSAGFGGVGELRLYGGSGASWFTRINFSVVDLNSNQVINWHGSGGVLGTADLTLRRDAAATLAQRNGTNGQKSRLYKTYTSATSGEWLELDAATDASNFDIAAAIGSAGGTARGIRIGGKNAAGTFTPWMSFSTAGVATFSGAITAPGGGSDTAVGIRFSTNAGCGFRTGTFLELRCVFNGTAVWATDGSGFNFGFRPIKFMTAGDPYATTGFTFTPVVGGMSFRGDSGIAVRNLANTADAPITASNATFNTGTITTSQPLSLSQTWDNAATTFTGLQVNATDTASNAASLLMDLQVGGVSKLRVDKTGAVFTDRIQFGSNVNDAVIKLSSAVMRFGYVGNEENRFYLSGGAIHLASNYQIGWSSASAATSGTIDLTLYRDAASTLAQRNGTNGQKSRLYKTYTSATSGEWLELDAATDASNFDIAASIGSAGGTARGIRIGGKNAAGTFTPWMSFSTAGVATFSGAITAPGGGSDTAVGIRFSTNAGCGFRTGTFLELRCVYNGTAVWATDGSGFNFGFRPIKFMTAGDPYATTGFTFTPVVGGMSFRGDSGIAVRNLANTADAPITASNITASGALQIGNAAVAETPVATHTLIIKDSTGTSYRVLAVAV